MKTYKVTLSNTEGTFVFVASIQVLGGLDEVYEAVKEYYPTCRMVGPNAIVRID